ncbi:MAG: hypothetical protein V8T62_03275 [Oscillospiraceae bacterium]
MELTFYGGSIPVTMPGEYRDYITEMRACFVSLDSAIADVESEMEDGDSLDSNRVKAVFYALYFGSDHLRLRSAAAKEFIDCFVYYEECVHPAEEEKMRRTMSIYGPIPSAIFPRCIKMWGPMPEER